MSTNASLKQIQDAFTAITKTPYCSGTFLLDPATSKIFYARNGKAEVIDFTGTTDAQLALLADTCQPATFRLKDKDVLDESYCKAGKIDSTEFATQFSPLTTGVIDAVKDSLLRGKLEGSGKALQVELYKLNVYGPGSFCKAHIDPPHSHETKLGSLIVVLPTVHEGGSLILRHKGHQNIFDTAHAVNSQNTPHAAFVAFIRGMEHEVAPVTSGYRVALTYNLHLTPTTVEPQGLGADLNISGTSANQIEELQKSLRNILNDPTFLPEGGFLGFGLSHKYPFKPNSFPSNLGQIVHRLKGGDAEVRRVCKALGLDVLLKALYTETTPVDENPCCLLDEFITFDETLDEVRLIPYIFGESGCKNPLVVYPHDMDLKYESFAKNNGKPIVWLRPFSKTNSFNTSYMHYGNESTVNLAYGDVCLVAKVAKAEDRIDQ